MVGRCDLLEFSDVSDHWKAKHLDLSPILYRPNVGPNVAIRNVQKQDHALGNSLDNRKLIRLAGPALERGEKVSADVEIHNTDRTVGTTLSGEVARKYGFAGLPSDTITFRFTGSAGQSFGCFLARGITLLLEGDANDYVGKGLSGGKIAVFPPRTASFKANENIIAGNTIGYGAIDGELYLRGVVGERFCVRNSGAKAVVEGCGDHGCEYMTGGRVVVLGPTGRNFAAGMSGGIAYVYDDTAQFPRLCNQDLVELEPADGEEDLETLRYLLESHLKLTDSPVARGILSAWEKERQYFVKVMPKDYRRVLQDRAEMESRAAALSKRQATAV
jgi:glutamate synthase domain-containing protein 3